MHPRALIALALLVPATWAQSPTAVELPGDLAVGPAAGEQRHAAIARGIDQSLIVYEDHRALLGDTVAISSNGVAYLGAARLDAAGVLVDSNPIAVRRGTDSPRDPRVAWNGSNYLVVWDELVRHPFQSDRGVYAARISAAGQLLDDPPILLADTSYVDESYPVVASDGTSWAVAWSGLAGGANAIQGRLVDANGVAGPVRTMMTTTIGLYFPVNFEMSWSNGRYLFVSQHIAPGGFFQDVLGQLFTPALVQVGTEFSISAGLGGAEASVAGNGSGFCVAWNQGNVAVRATPVSSTGTVLVPGGVNLMGSAPGNAGYQLPAVAWDGSDWAVAFGTASGANSSMNVSKLSTSGTLVNGSPLAISQGSWEMSRPACAPATGGVQVVWDDVRNNPNPIAGFASDRTDVYGSLVTSAGGVGAAVDLSQSPPAQLDPQIAGDAAHGYLAAFFSVTQSTLTVNVQRLDAGGRPIDQQPIPLLSGPRTLHNLALAWNGSNWLLVWDEFTLGGTSIHGLRISANGTALDASPIPIMPGNGASVAAVGGDYLVVATDEPVVHQRFVYTMRVRGSDGALLDPAPVQRTFQGFDGQTAVAAFQDRWIVAWVHMVTHDAPASTLRYMLVYASGGSSAADVAGTGIALANNEPALAVDGLQALLAWSSGGDILGRRILQDGTKLDSDAGFAIASANNLQFAPGVAWNGDEFAVAFADYRAHVGVLETGIGDVYSTRVDANGVVLDPAGTALAIEPLRPEGRPSIAGGAGATVVALDVLDTNGPFGNWRVAVTADVPATGTAFCFGDGSGTACPCGNAGAPGNGCANSVDPNGANLSASGVASIAGDSLVLAGMGMPNSSALYFQATAQAGGGLGFAFGDGLRCTSGAVVRLGTAVNVAGSSRYPGPGDPLVSVRGLVSAPGTRTYQVWYRNAANYCAASTFNLTNGTLVPWVP